MHMRACACACGMRAWVLHGYMGAWVHGCMGVCVRVCMHAHSRTCCACVHMCDGHVHRMRACACACACRQVEKHNKIARHYIYTWFWFDLSTLIPSVFDIIPAVCK